MQVFFEFLDFGVVGGLGSGWAKLNVVFLCRQVLWQNTSFNFVKRWQFLFSISLSCPEIAIHKNRVYAIKRREIFSSRE